MTPSVAISVNRQIHRFISKETVGFKFMKIRIVEARSDGSDVKKTLAAWLSCQDMSNHIPQLVDSFYADFEHTLEANPSMLFSGEFGSGTT